MSADPRRPGYDHFLESTSTTWRRRAAAVGALEGGLHRAVLPVGRLLRDAPPLLRAFVAPRRRYSLPPENLADLPEVRRDMARSAPARARWTAASAGARRRSRRTASDERTLVILTTDHGCRSRARRRRCSTAASACCSSCVAPAGSSAAGCTTRWSAIWTCTPRSATSRGSRPTWLQGTTLLPLARGDRPLHDELFAEVTYHAAYEPQRAVRTDRYKHMRRYDAAPGPSSPTPTTARPRSARRTGWDGWTTEDERCTTSSSIPARAATSSTIRPRGVRATCAGGCERWMERTEDPLLRVPSRSRLAAARRSARAVGRRAARAAGLAAQATAA